MYMKRTRVMEIWITNKIEPNEASWNNFFKVNVEPLTGWPFLYNFRVDSFFIEKEKKVAVVSGDLHNSNGYDYDTTIVVGEDGFYKKLYFVQVFSYVPSSVQIQ
ncbi:F-box protein [Cardamine amara subsp. amara]|uniref:F-box protein n=1 Tax=Cardamine amara subsp. amara TaxID=228776 RepID=A0ABD0Z787_CARAN